MFGLGKIAQMCQSAVVLLALGEERRKEIGNILHKTDKAFELSRLVSEDSESKIAKGDTNEPSDVGGVADAVKLDQMFNIGKS